VLVNYRGVWLQSSRVAGKVANVGTDSCATAINFCSVTSAFEKCRRACVQCGWRWLMATLVLKAVTWAGSSFTCPAWVLSERSHAVGRGDMRRPCASRELRISMTLFGCAYPRHPKLVHLGAEARTSELHQNPQFPSLWGCIFLSLSYSLFILLTHPSHLFTSILSSRILLFSCHVSAEGHCCGRWLYVSSFLGLASCGKLTGLSSVRLERSSHHLSCRWQCCAS
jgi:hypothetical protein